VLKVVMPVLLLQVLSDLIDLVAVELSSKARQHAKAAEQASELETRLSNRVAELTHAQAVLK
jgi:hypothetical protein